MVHLTRLNRAPLVLNSDLIEHIDITPDTVITLTNGQIVRVLETAEEVIERVVEFRRKIYGMNVVAEAEPEGSCQNAPEISIKPAE
jgi:flagellar protein FlbD